MNLHVGTHSLKDVSVKAEIDANKARINERDANGRTPLLAACFAKNWELASYYVGLGADVQAQDKFGATAIIFACMMGKMDLAELFVTRGANLHAANNIGRNALSFINNAEQKEKLLALAERVAADGFPSSTSSYVTPSITTTSAIIPSTSTPAPTASNVTDSGSKSLSERRFPENSGKQLTIETGTRNQDRAPKPPTDVANPVSKITSKSTSNTEAVAVAATAKPPPPQSVATKSPPPPTTNTTGSQSPQVASIVSASHGSSPMKVASPANQRDIHGRTPLIMACWAKAWDEVRRLVESGADVLAKDNYGATPIIVVCLLAQFDIAMLLVQHGAELYACNNVGRDALSFVNDESERKKLQVFVILFLPDDRVVYKGISKEAYEEYKRSHGNQVLEQRHATRSLASQSIKTPPLSFVPVTSTRPTSNHVVTSEELRLPPLPETLRGGISPREHNGASRTSPTPPGSSAQGRAPHSHDSSSSSNGNSPRDVSSSREATTPRDSHTPRGLPVTNLPRRAASAGPVPMSPRSSSGEVSANHSIAKATVPEVIVVPPKAEIKSVPSAEVSTVVRNSSPVTVLPRLDLSSLSVKRETERPTNGSSLSGVSAPVPIRAASPAPSGSKSPVTTPSPPPVPETRTYNSKSTPGGDIEPTSSPVRQKMAGVARIKSTTNELNDPAYEEMRQIVQSKEDQMRAHLIILQDMEAIVEVNPTRLKLMTHLRARISDIERTLQQIRNEKMKENLASATPPAATSASSDNKKKVVLDESDAKLELHQRRMAKLKTLAGFNPEDETIARNIEEEIQRLSSACKVMYSEEQLSEAPAMAVVLFHKQTNSYRIFFVCSYTLRVVLCGSHGNGYPLKKSVGWFSQAKASLLFCTIALNCGIISHPFDQSTDYADLCDSQTSRGYLQSIITYLRATDDTMTECDESTTSASAFEEPSIWNLFGSLQCASTVFNMSGKFLMDGLDSGVGACTRVFTGDFGRLDGDTDSKFSLRAGDIRGASTAFHQMLRSSYPRDDWLPTLRLKCFADDRGVNWINADEMIVNDFESEIVVSR